MNKHNVLSCFVGICFVGICHAELTITRVWPEKIFTHPGETNFIEVAVANPDKTPASAQLKVVLMRDLDARTALYEGLILVASSQTNQWRLAWTARAWL